MYIMSEALKKFFLRWWAIFWAVMTYEILYSLHYSDVWSDPQHKNTDQINDDESSTVMAAIFRVVFWRCHPAGDGNNKFKVAILVNDRSNRSVLFLFLIEGNSEN